MSSDHVAIYDDASSSSSSSSSDEADNVASLCRASAANARLLVSEITDISTRLSSLMKNESQDGNERAKVLQNLDTALKDEHSEEHSQVKSGINNMLQSANSAVERLDKQCKILISNQRGMEEKIRKKTIDLDLTSKRLESLKHVRPAYLDEYEQLEEELQKEYEIYVVRLRNIDYLEGELSTFEALANERQKKADRSMKRMQKQFREEELRILNGDDAHEVEATSSSSSRVQPRETTKEDDAAGEISKMDASVDSSRDTNTYFSGSDGSSYSFSEGSESGDEMSGSTSDSNF